MKEKMILRSNFAKLLQDGRRAQAETYTEKFATFQFRSQFFPVETNDRGPLEFTEADKRGEIGLFSKLLTSVARCWLISREEIFKL